MTKGEQVDLQTHGSPLGHHLLQFLHMSETETVVMTVEKMMVGMTVMLLDHSDLPCTGDAVKRLPYSSCCKPIHSIQVNTTCASCHCLLTSSNMHLEVNHKCQMVFDWLTKLCRCPMVAIISSKVSLLLSSLL
jgi:hypothetical protein